MSSAFEAVSLLVHLALSADGAFAGVTYIAIKIWHRYFSTSSSLRKISQAPTIKISDLHSVISTEESDSESVCGDEKLVVVRGIVEAKSSVDGSLMSLEPNILNSQEPWENSVLLQLNQTYIYTEWRGLLTTDWRTNFARPWKDKTTTSIETEPFVLVERGQSPRSDYVIVDLDGSVHPLPLTTVYHQLLPVQASPPTFFETLFGYTYPIGLLQEFKILPLGKEISAVGICGLNDGVVHIKSQVDLPCFLSAMTKDQMVNGLASKTKALFWSGIILGSLSISILSYATVRRWRKWRQQRQDQRTRDFATAALAAKPPLNDATEDVLDGKLCVICLTRRKRSVFVPCGHKVCCQRCALSVQRQYTPKCPVCRQPISSSVRICEP